MTQPPVDSHDRGGIADASRRDAPSALLEVRDLRTYFHTDAGDAKSVDGISFSIDAGKTLAVVGESGCGKTVTALSILQLVPRPPGEFVSGQIRFEGQDLLKLPAHELRARSEERRVGKECRL